MKRKDIITLAIAAVILGVAGIIIYGQTAPKKAKARPTIEVVTPIPTDYNQAALGKLTDSGNVKDFYTDPNLKSGLGNNQLFGQ